MSTSLSLTRLMRWPNSVTSSSAVSWSMVWVSVTGVPILNSALTRSAPRSAMRLASSWTVIASGTTTSRTCLADGPGLHVVALFLLAGAAERGERAGAAVVLVGQGAGDGELAAMALIVRGRGSGARARGAWARAHGRRGGGRRARPRSAAAGSGGFGLGRRLRRRGAASSSARQASLFGGSFFGLAVFFGAAALVLALRDLGALLAAARFLERGQARFLGLAQQLGLQFLAAR